MIPPRGFEMERYPLRHRLIYSFGLSVRTGTMNSACTQLIHSTSDMDAESSAIKVNPHNSAYVSDGGAVVRQMSIIDKLRLSIRINMTDNCNDRAETASGVFTGDGIKHIKLLWRPIFFSFPEKLDAADDDTTTTVAAILGLTKDATNEDVVPLTTNKLPVIGTSDLFQPLSTVNQTQVIADLNYTTDASMEDHVWDEDIFQDALRRYTNKGALKACIGRTRYVNLNRNNPYYSFYAEKWVPRPIRRVVPYGFFAIQFHLPMINEIDQDYMSNICTPSVAHVGIKVIANYHEWNHQHDQDMGSQV